MCWIKLSFLAKFSKLIKFCVHQTDIIKKFPVHRGRWDQSREAIIFYFFFICIGDDWLDRLLSLHHQLNIAVLAQSEDKGLCVVAIWTTRFFSEFQIQLLVWTWTEYISSNCFMILFPLNSLWVFIVVLCFSLDPVFGKELGRNADKSRWVCWNVGHGKLSSS